MIPPPAGALWYRMPDRYPAVPQDRINEIRTWISAGCPDAAPASISTVDSSSPASLTQCDYVNFWRFFDNVALFEATDEVQTDVGNFFNVATQ